MSKRTGRSGPLNGVRILELGGIGPVPFCAMMLSDMGAEVLRLERIAPSDSGVAMDAKFNLLNRGRPTIAIDLKKPGADAAVLALVVQADALLEGFRPGVAERLHLGPDECLKANPRLVFGRLTGWGQNGPLAQEPGHDINYIAISGALHSIGVRGAAPVPPLNLVGDFGGGAMYLAFGVACALLESKSSGKGQIVDAAMIDGAASLMTMMYGMHAAGVWSDERGTNRLDTGAPWYNVYETSDGSYVSIGANEPRFYRNLLVCLGLDTEELPHQHDRLNWPVLAARFSQVFRSKTRDEWTERLEGREACFAPVLSMAEAPQHPQNLARNNFVAVDGIVQPAPAPRFSRTPGRIPEAAPVDSGGSDILEEWGISADQIASWRAAGIIL
jgi:alpha-methylacyl-CoA racemase